MEIKNFLSACGEQGYEWCRKEHEGTDGYLVGCKRLDTAAHFSLEAIRKHEWPVLERGIKQGKDVYHVTRVVGYYSRVQNWNKSKKGELEDRYKGDYKIT